VTWQYAARVKASGLFPRSTSTDGDFVHGPVHSGRSSNGCVVAVCARAGCAQEIAAETATMRALFKTGI
jgi:hypothetical protein